MKKCLCMLLAGALVFSLSACLRDQTVDAPSDDTEDNEIKSTEMYTNFLNNYSSNTELFYFIKDSINSGLICSFFSVIFRIGFHACCSLSSTLIYFFFLSPFE